MLKLVKPALKYKKSYLAALKEFETDKINRETKYDEAAKDFKKYIRHYKLREKGEWGGKDWVPDTTYWLVSGNKYLGRISIRHQLTPKLKKMGGHIGYAIRPTERRKGYATKMLKMVLPKAKKLGITQALLTCDISNIPSRKVIEANGGKLKDVVKKNSYARFLISLNKK